MEKDERELTIIGEDGKETKATILFTHHDEDFEKDYVVFETEDGTCSAASYVASEGNGGKLDPVETEEEWDMLQEVLEKYLEEHADEFEQKA